jgi:hypothetical protein
LFHLENTLLGRSTASAAIDPRLLYVTGFDAGTQRFTYRVNQLFGQPLDYGLARVTYPPFELQIGAEYRFGYPPPVNTSVQSRLGLFRNGPDTAAAMELVRAAVAKLFGGNPVDAILMWRDSLALTSDQVTGIQLVREEYRARADSLTAPLVAFAIREGKSLTQDQLFDQGALIVVALRAVQADERAKAVRFLLPHQRELLARLTRSP